MQNNFWFCSKHLSLSLLRLGVPQGKRANIYAKNLAIFLIVNQKNPPNVKKKIIFFLYKIVLLFPYIPAGVKAL